MDDLMAELSPEELALMQRMIDARNAARMQGELLPEGRGPTMRSTNTRLGDIMAETSGSPAIGRVLTNIEHGGRGVMNVGSELTMIPQAIRTGNAVAEAALDPSIANVTNAGANAAMTALRPMAALKVLGGGYAAAGGKDLMSGYVSDANAQSKGARDMVRAEAERAKAEAAAATAKAQAEAAILQAKTAAEKQAAEQRAAEADAALARTQKEKSAEAYRHGISRAEQERQKALDRDRRFSDSETFKLYEKTGGLTPFIAGAAGGAAYRAVKGVPKTAQEEWLNPMLAGIGPGEAFAHGPAWYNAHMTEPDNPELRGNEAFARVAPAGPDRDRALAEAKRLRTEQPTNPVHDAGQAEFYDPWKFAERTLAGAFQGATGGKTGALAAALPSAVVRAAGAAPGEYAAGKQRGIAASEAERAGADAARLRANSVARDAAQSDRDLQTLQQQLAQKQQQLGEAGALTQGESTQAASTSQRAGATTTDPSRSVVLTTTQRPVQPALTDPNQLTLPPPADHPMTIHLDGFARNIAEGIVNGNKVFLAEVAKLQKDAAHAPAAADMLSRVESHLNEISSLGARLKTLEKKALPPPPPPPPPNPEVTIPPGMRGSKSWEPYRESAWDQYMAHADKPGANFVGAKGKTNDPRVLTARQVHGNLKDAAGNAPTFSQSVTENSMTRLREILKANGIDPANVSKAQLEEMRKKIPAYLAGAAGLTAVGGDLMSFSIPPSQAASMRSQGLID